MSTDDPSPPPTGEDPFRALAEASVVGLCRYAPDGTLLWTSASMALLAGLPRPGAAPVHLTVHPEDAGLAAGAFAAALATDRPQTVEIRTRHSGGGWRRVESTVRAWRDATGRVLEVHAANLDVTERWERAAALAQAVTRFESAFADAAVGMMVARDGRVERANTAIATLLGTTPEAMVGRDPVDWVHPEDLPRAVAAVAELTAGIVPAPQDRRLVATDGRVLHVRLSYAQLEHAETVGRGAAAFLVHCIDRTAEVASTTARDAALAQFSTAVENAPIGMCLTDIDGAVLRVNPALCRLLGRPAEALLGWGVRSSVHPDDAEADTALRAELSAGMRDGYELTKRYLRGDGSSIHALLTVSLVRGPDGAPMQRVAQLVDLSDVRTVQDQLRLLEDRDRIARDLHDHVIQRLFATGLSLQSLASELGPGLQADRLERSIGDLDTTISSIRTAIYSLHAPIAPDLNTVRTRVMEIVAELTPVLGREPAVHFDGPLDAMVGADVVVDVMAVLREALTNIARHARARSTRVDLRVLPTTRELQVEVLDDGRGLGESTRRSGLANLRTRATGRGGQFEIESPPANAPCGTRLVWTVPLS
ncbi:MAG: sensor histidine kinase [Sporichthyaceae bacterium]